MAGAALAAAAGAVATYAQLPLDASMQSRSGAATPPKLAAANAMVSVSPSRSRSYPTRSCLRTRPRNPAQERRHCQGRLPKLRRAAPPQADRGRELREVAAGCGHAGPLGSDGAAEACGRRCKG